MTPSSSAFLRNQLAYFPFHSIICSFQLEFFTFPDLSKTDCTFELSSYICICEVSMLVFLLLVRKRKYSRNKKRSFICLCHKNLLHSVSIFEGEKVICKCYLHFRRKSDWYYSGLLRVRGSSLGEARLCLWVGGKKKWKAIEVRCNGVLGCRKDDHILI